MSKQRAQGKPERTRARHRLRAGKQINAARPQIPMLAEVRRTSSCQRHWQGQARKPESHGRFVDRPWNEGCNITIGSLTRSGLRQQYWRGSGGTMTTCLSQGTQGNLRIDQLNKPATMDPANLSLSFKACLELQHVDAVSPSF